MEVWIFGNPDLAQDALPIKILPRLREQCPHITFMQQDPLDEWVMPPELTIIDTVRGLDKARAFDSLDAFQQDRRVSMHDFDLGFQLMFLKKLGQLPKLRLIGVPPDISEDEAVRQVAAILGPA